MARLSLLFVLALVLLSYIGPTAEYLRAWSLAKDTRAEVEALQGDNERLRERARHLRRLETAELEARRAGMAKPGERVYVIRGLPEDR